ncbi:intradiol ring-cleavage dioxygenase [Nesterenkonia muleiensis]|uniref:intradiol ring-cleavage dioxygenase n=1 Tax=Nesterenkonia muleiensis TaxID=2282648 RepID=UPI000E72809E|nr:intradiol ring-cleavage dioxygenase [Nesterenkonia muleiensis]
MARFPDVTHTPQGPAYEGRLLHRTDEEVVDQGAPFDIQTLITRRGVIGLVGVGVGTATLAACAPADSSGSSAAASAGQSSSSSASSSSASADSGASVSTEDLPDGEIPEETAGPYPGDGSNGPDVLEQSGIVREDIRSSIDGGGTAEGVALTFSFTVLDMANGDTPFEGVAVYAWHCDAQGGYSMYSEGLEDESYLRGVQVADADGIVTFTSIFPGCYTGRWPHIHFEVYPDVESIDDYTNAIATSQLAFPEEVCQDVYELSEYSGSAQNLSQITVETDNVFGEDGGELQMATVSGDLSTGYTASLVVRVDTTTAPSAGGGAPGGETPPGGEQAPGGPGPGDAGPGGGSGGPNR